MYLRNILAQEIDPMVVVLIEDVHGSFWAPPSLDLGECVHLLFVH